MFESSFIYSYTFTHLFYYLPISTFCLYFLYRILQFRNNHFSINLPQKTLLHITDSKIKGRPKSSLYFALGAIRTRDLSLKRGVLYQLSYKRKLNSLFISSVVLSYQEHFLMSTVFLLFSLQFPQKASPSY